MRLTPLIPLVATAAVAFVIPDEATIVELQIEQPKQRHDSPGIASHLPSTTDLLHAADDAFSSLLQSSRRLLDDMISRTSQLRERAPSMPRRHRCRKSRVVESAPDSEWLDSALATETRDWLGYDDVDDADGARHHHDGDHGHHGHHGHHGDPHKRSNLTVYQLIKKSKYTTTLAKLIDEDGDLVSVLNSTKANYTVFAPTDDAFERLPKHERPSKDDIKKVLLYHVSADYYPASRVLLSHTIPTLLKEKDLGNFPQRIRIGLGLKGLELDFYSPVVAVNIFGSNGVIHGIGEVLMRPLPVLEIFDFMPAEFSTLQLGLLKTGLHHDFSVTATSGQTFFAPSNWAFRLLGYRTNAFLFSQRGRKYLKALLKYHVVSNQTLYSDAYYDAKHDKATHHIPKSYLHIDLPTLLDGRPVGVDIARYGGFISIKVNGFVTVTVQDGVAKDGVVQVVSNVLIPPKKLDGPAEAAEKLTLEEIVERLEPYVERDDDNDSDYEDEGWERALDGDWEVVEAEL